MSRQLVPAPVVVQPAQQLPAPPPPPPPPPPPTPVALLLPTVDAPAVIEAPSTVENEPTIIEATAVEETIPDESPAGADDGENTNDAEDEDNAQVVETGAQDPDCQRAAIAFLDAMAIQLGMNISGTAPSAEEHLAVPEEPALAPAVEDTTGEGPVADPSASGTTVVSPPSRATSLAARTPFTFGPAATRPRPSNSQQASSSSSAAPAFDLRRQFLSMGFAPPGDPVYRTGASAGPSVGVRSAAGVATVHATAAKCAAGAPTGSEERSSSSSSASAAGAVEGGSDTPHDPKPLRRTVHLHSSEEFEECTTDDFEEVNDRRGKHI